MLLSRVIKLFNDYLWDEVKLYGSLTDEAASGTRSP
jgi:hypothetical protein